MLPSPEQGSGRNRTIRDNKTWVYLNWIILAVLLAQYYTVNAVDIMPEKVEKINKRISPIQDEYIEKYLAEKELDLTATLEGEKAYWEADFIIIATPTNYAPRENFFDCSAVEAVIEAVIKSTEERVAASCKLSECAGRTDNGNCGIKPHPQGLYRRQGIGESRLLFLYRIPYKLPPGTGENDYCRRIPPDNEIKF